MEFLNDMALFVEVVKAGSFRRAAEIIGTPNSTLSRRVSSLEKAIGLRLLHRTTRKIELTEAGQIYFARSRQIVDDARRAHRQLGEMLTHPGGTLQVSLPVDFANAFLAPIIAEFSRRYPDLNFSFDLTSRHVDLVAEPVDVAIRMGNLPNSNLIARPLARLPRYLYASPQYIDAHGEPAEPADLLQHECLRFGPSESNTWKLHNETDSVEIAVEGRFMLNSVGMIRRLATLDLGIAVLAEGIAADDVANGLLRRVMPEWRVDAIPVYAITETRLIPAKTQIFIEFLREHFRP